MNGKTISQDHISSQGIRSAENLQEEQVNKILANFKKNLSLEQLENLEKMVKKTHFAGKNYIEH